MAARRLAAIATWAVVLASMTGCLAVLDGPRYRDGAAGEHDAQGVDAVVPDAVQRVDALDAPPPTGDAQRVDATPVRDAQRGDAVAQPDVLVGGDAQPDVAVDAGACTADRECVALGSACATPVCAAGHCTTRPTNCDDGQPCTDDVCALPGGCVHVPNAATCDLGMGACARGLCAGGTCSVATMMSCDPTQVCDTTTGRCICPAGTRLCTSGGPGTCVPLTGSCCSDGECAALQTCQAGRCASCGLLGLLCCGTSGCAAGAVCDLVHTPALCQGCGGPGQLCCAGGVCALRLTCTMGRCS